MKNKLNILLTGGLVVTSVATAVLLVLNDRMKKEHAQKDIALRKVMVKNFHDLWHVGTYAEDLMFVRSCHDILQAASNVNCSALFEYARILTTQMPQVGHCDAAEKALKKAFYDSFLWRGERLAEFDSLAALEAYLRINLELMIHYGNLDIRAGNFEILPAKEYLGLKTMNDYKNKFRMEKKVSYEKIVSDYLERLIAHIESPDGFTRKSAHYMMRLNTEFANAVKVNGGVSDASGLKIGRAMANGLVNCGYTPKWLDEDFPLNQKDNAKDGE